MKKIALSLIVAGVAGACAVSSEPPGDTGPVDGGENGSEEVKGDSDCAAAATFMEVGPYAGEAGAGHPDPELGVRCEGTNVVVTSNGIPHYEFFSITPNALAAQNHVYTFPRDPAVAAEKTPIPLLGVVALGVNGLPVYGPNEAALPDPYGDPVYNEIVDFCKGHTGHRGDYHYHALLVQCLSDLGVDATPAVDAVSPVIGWALDGFPIYGPLGCLDEACAEVVEFQSGWERTGDPTTYAWDNHAYVPKTDVVYLDRCNGRVGPDGTYRYHATVGFPYVLGCYTGTPGTATNEGGGAPGGGNPGGWNPGDGSSDDGNPGPSICEEDGDCIGVCPQASLGCRCAETPTGEKRCIPSCTTDSDCPDGGPANLVCDTEKELCVPEGPGGPGGDAPPPGDSGAGSPPPGDSGPTTCEEDEDCVEVCAVASLGCECAPIPTGEKVCIPRCTTTSDCPVGGPTTLLCDTERGLCEPDGGTPPPGGSGPTTCEEDNDCAEVCAGAQLGCKCASIPTGEKICVLRCTTTSDCPADGPVTLVCDPAEGLCLGSRPADGTGENPEGGVPPPGEPGPTTCEMDGDCVDLCAGMALGCRCVQTHTGEKTCIPLCTTDDDCPVIPDMTLVCDTDKGLCEPEGAGTGAGGDPGGGPPPTVDSGPTICEEDVDCADACPGASLGCRCVDTPAGEKHCVPKCTTSSDCPDGGPNTLVCKADEGICVPEGGPGGN